MLFAACYLLLASLDRDKRGQVANSKKREAKNTHPKLNSGKIKPFWSITSFLSPDSHYS